MKINPVFVALAIMVASIVQAAPISAHAVQMLSRSEAVTAVPAGRGILKFKRSEVFKPAAASLGRCIEETMLQTRTIGDLFTEALRKINVGKKSKLVTPLPIPRVIYVPKKKDKDPVIEIYNPRKGLFRGYGGYLYNKMGRREDDSTAKADYTWEDILDEEDWMNKWHAKEQMKLEIPHLQGEGKAQAEEKVAANEALLMSFPDAETNRRWYPVYFHPPDQWLGHSEASQVFALLHPHWDQLTGPQRRRAVDVFNERRHRAA